MKFFYPENTLYIWCSPELVYEIPNLKNTEGRVENSKWLNTSDSFTILKEKTKPSFIQQIYIKHFKHAW